MSKAIEGVAEIAAGIALEFVPGMGMLGTILIAAGATTEMGAIAQALGSNQGMGVTTRQPAGLRQIIRGEQRVGGTMVYISTTGHSKRQYNMVIVLATHPCEAIENLYLDGRQVFWNAGSDYNQTINGVNFGGDAALGNHTGPTGVQYNFGGLVFCAGFCGHQNSSRTDGGIFGGWAGPATWNDGDPAYAGYCTALNANDGTWAPSVQPGVGSAVADPVMGSGGGGGAPISGGTILNPGFGYASGSVAITVVRAPGDTGVGDAIVSGTASGGLLTSISVTYGGLYTVTPSFIVAPPSSTTVTPYLAGCTYVYLKIEADSTTFPQFPEIRFTMRGKNDIYDPRTATTGYTTNWALHIADVLANPDPMLGIGDGPISSWPTAALDQLIAAANVCDEMVTCAAGSEARYSVHCHYDSSVGPGDAIQKMMPAAAGRLSRIGGGWFIWPAYWQSASANFDQNSLVEAIQWSDKRKFAQLCNRVTGTYIAPNFPYNVAGNLYDSNGFFNGETQNNFPYGFQPTSFPMYAADALHGYGAGVDVYLQQDGDIPLPKDLTLDCVLSVSQAQRLAKIELLRNRQQGSGTFVMSLAAFAMQPVDVMEFTFPALGWTNKNLEIAGAPNGEMKLRLGKTSDGDEVPGFVVEVPVNETDSSVYEWAPTEELTPYDVPALSGAVEAFSVAPPTSLTATGGLSAALVAPDGTITPRIELGWTEPDDTYVTNGGSIEIQMCLHGTGLFQDVLVVGGQTTVAFLSPVTAGLSYDVQIRSVRPTGGSSAWVQALNVGVSVSGNNAVIPTVAPVGTCLGIALTSSTAEIIVNPFTATVGAQTASCLAGGAVTLTGLAPATQYYVYYSDPTFAGGAITPIAATGTSAFLFQAGYYLIGIVEIPLYNASSSPAFYPTEISNLGVTSVSGAPAGAVSVTALTNGSGSYFGEALVHGFPSTVIIGSSRFGGLGASSLVVSGASTPWLLSANDFDGGGGTKPPGPIGTLNARGAWAATTAYSVWDTFTITYGSGLLAQTVEYLVVTAYTSGSSFGPTDYAKSCIVLAAGTSTRSGPLFTSAGVPTFNANLAGVSMDLTVNAPASAGQTIATVTGISVIGVTV